jgi:uncharacterized protein
MPQFISFLEPVRPSFPGDGTPEEFAIVGNHFSYLQAKLAKNELFLAGRTQDEMPIGIVIFDETDMDGAMAFASQDPAVSSGLFRVTVRPYAVALMKQAHQ